tara:strand:+ start:447 stop:638 length:192 start_codon:yes stop_codon:yes gene_type:complete
MSLEKTERKITITGMEKTLGRFLTKSESIMLRTGLRKDDLDKLKGEELFKIFEACWNQKESRG